MGLPDIDNIPDTGAVFTLESGRLFVFGSNDWGQLGLGHKNHVSKPSCVKTLKPEKVTHVACGRAHTLICTGEEKLLACGSDQESQLGRGQISTGDCSTIPVVIYDCGKSGPKILEIAAGSHHSLALTSDGGVLAWGSNLEGQLGLPGTSGLINKPTKVNLPEPIKHISAGYYHSAFLSESGVIYICGEAESGKLGISLDFRTQIAPKSMQLPVKAVSVACGGHHTLILGESGKLFMCGDGRHGKLGLEENENNVHELTLAVKYQELIVTNVACGGCHTILVGHKKDMDNDDEKSKMKINSLPPLKIPNNRMQSESNVKEEDDSINGGTEDTEQLNDKKLETTEGDSSLDNAEKKSETQINSSENGTPLSTDKPLEIDDKLSNDNIDLDYDNNMKNEEDNTVNNNNNFNNNNNNNKNIEDVIKSNEVDAKVEAETIAERPTSSNGQLSINNKVEDKKDEEKSDDSIKENGDDSIKEMSNEETIIKKNSIDMSPPPKPPRQKIDSENSAVIKSNPSSRESSSSSRTQKNKVEPSVPTEPIASHDIDNNVNNDDDDDDNDDVTSIVSDNQKSSSIKSKSSARSKADTDETVAMDETKISQSIATLEKDINNLKDNIVGQVDEKVDKVAKVADDIDNVIRSPPRAGKIMNLFKNKKQVADESTNSSIEPIVKAKSKTCSIL
ncbi:Similar to RPGR: X-linked retinitis pigmentosa GTPase regulator (Canis lupus familiaris) [Cotesia congregata]|uniref:Similar to RPGR: X-linked retinitis pigmentosa GTPase regulator (Canis lupus familiaris) n=1 Tax=Cotesia congregata TaxID=51543 RepID=A0A8J2HF21_COTCN|nr:Similar to RPGR: X-linked retinitis pigmentosa GTPase regulator (Canis lupus familiaris) [Cotesia congregata]